MEYVLRMYSLDVPDFIVKVYISSEWADFFARCLSVNILIWTATLLLVPAIAPVL